MQCTATFMTTHIVMDRIASTKTKAAGRMHKDCEVTGKACKIDNGFVYATSLAG